VDAVALAVDVRPHPRVPVVGIKTVSLLKLGAEANSYRRSIQLTIAGILASFLGLAVITILLKSLGHQVGWGFQFQSPAFVTFMILIIFLFALNLFDLFQFQIGSKSASAVSNLRGAFFEGVFATLLATPCSAPFLGTALTFAISQSAPILILMFLVMGLGLSTPYLALLFFPTLLRFLPAPGPWMITLRRALGYSMLFAVFFLLYIVHQQTEPLFLFAILGALFVIFILLRELQSVAKWIFIICVGLWSLQFSLSMQLGDGGMVGRKEGQFNQDSNVIPFDETKLQSLLNEGRNVYVMVTADWCLTCKFNEKTVIETEWFEGQLKDRNIVFMVADWTQRDEKIGKFLESHKRVAIPFSMLIDKNHELVLPELLTRSVVEKSFDQFFGK
jgi:thiol:disulfide interchange protein